MKRKIKEHTELVNKFVKAENTIFKVQKCYGRNYSNPNDKDHGKYMYSFLGWSKQGHFVRKDVFEYEIVENLS